MPLRIRRKPTTPSLPPVRERYDWPASAMARMRWISFEAAMAIKIVGRMIRVMIIRTAWKMSVTTTVMNPPSIE